MGPVLMRVAVGAGEWAAGCLRVWCSSVLHMGGEGLCGTRGWFLLGLWVFLMIVVCGGRAPMCGEGGLRTWERSRGDYLRFFSA